jgi:RNA polymerase sigma factor (sigma-70 family)
MALKNLDNALILAAQGGDRQAMEELLSLSQPDIRRYAMRHCLISDVDDAVQEVLIIIARRLDSLRILAAFSSWLFKTVQRECRRLGRVALQYDPFEETELEAWLQSKPGNELQADLINAVDRLQPEYRQVLLLKDFEQLANREIAARLNISVAAVKSRLHRARQMIRSELLK